MTKLIAEISMSLDGYVAGPAPSLEDPLGAGGMQLHEWAFRLEAWRSAHGLEGGETDVDSALVEAHLRATGAVVMGRRMFSGGSGPWEGDPNARGWWGDDPPFHNPVFVLTHHPRETLEMKGGTSFEFVTDGIAAAVERARAAAGERNVLIAGGAEAVQEGLGAGLVDELLLHVSPVLLGGGTPLFGAQGSGTASSRRLEITEVVAGPLATHVRYHIAR